MWKMIDRFMPIWVGVGSGVAFGEYVPWTIAMVGGVCVLALFAILQAVTKE